MPPDLVLAPGVVHPRVEQPLLVGGEGEAVAGIRDGLVEDLPGGDVLDPDREALIAGGVDCVREQGVVGGGGEGRRASRTRRPRPRPARPAASARPRATPRLDLRQRSRIGHAGEGGVVVARGGAGDVPPVVPAHRHAEVGLLGVADELVDQRGAEIREVGGAARRRRRSRPRGERSPRGRSCRASTHRGPRRCRRGGCARWDGGAAAGPTEVHGSWIERSRAAEQRAQCRRSLEGSAEEPHGRRRRRRRRLPAGDQRAVSARPRGPRADRGAMPSTPACRAEASAAAVGTQRSSTGRSCGSEVTRARSAATQMAASRPSTSWWSSDVQANTAGYSVARMFSAGL